MWKPSLCRCVSCIVLSKLSAFLLRGLTPLHWYVLTCFSHLTLLFKCAHLFLLSFNYFYTLGFPSASFQSYWYYLNFNTELYHYIFHFFLPWFSSYFLDYNHLLRYVIIFILYFWSIFFKYLLLFKYFIQNCFQCSFFWVNILKYFMTLGIFLSWPHLWMTLKLDINLCFKFFSFNI